MGHREDFEDTVKVILHLTLHEEDMHIWYKTICGRFGHNHNTIGPHSQHVEMFLASPGVCEGYGDLDKSRPYRHYTKSLDLFKYLSEPEEMAVMTVHWPLLYRTDIHHTHWLSSVRVKPSGFVGAVLGAPEVVVDVYLHTLCKKKSPELQVSHNSKFGGLPSGFGHVHDCTDSSSQCMAILIKMSGTLMSVMFKQVNIVGIPQRCTANLVCVLKNDLLATRYQTPSSDDYFLIPCGVLTCISYYDKVSLQSPALESNIYMFCNWNLNLLKVTQSNWSLRAIGFVHQAEEASIVSWQSRLIDKTKQTADEMHSTVEDKTS
jgi:hypothetical protein